MLVMEEIMGKKHPIYQNQDEVVTSVIGNVIPGVTLTLRVIDK